MTQVHILNGDSTYHQFLKTSIEGDTLIWREILCEGPVTTSVASPEYWQQRRRYLQSSFPSGSEKYFDQFRQDVSQFDPSKYEEIVLWFEYDLFCQINLLAVLSWLQEINKIAVPVSLVCIGHLEGYSKKVGLGEIDPQQYYSLYNQRSPLNEADLELATQIWTIYRSSNHDALLRVLKSAAQSNTFEYLESAILAHQERFPDPNNGLTVLEQIILMEIQHHSHNKDQLVASLLKRRNDYGFGDLQYFQMIDALNPLLKSNGGILSLNSLGHEVLNGHKNFSSYRNRQISYGGANIDDFSYDPEQKKLLPIS